MSKKSPDPSERAASSSSVADALDKNRQATAEVKRAADDLAVVHAVLDAKVAQNAGDGDVKRAVEETSRVEKRLGHSAEELDRVNEALEREVRHTR